MTDRQKKMAKPAEPTIIKKYANRRLYNTGTSSYVTLEDLAEMVKREELFVVYDAKSGDGSDVLFDKQGKVDALIVGIGGFLGIGQKDVALRSSR